ncbi:MAG TPA: hypothetical protein VL242_05430 [Sorangium sp.]|uniref:Uncharacterized protein n=1 Tax=Sorangium cellulosum TaxID=56 RepID=A0A150SAS2_SORCE|nr:hypothetical protein BE17_03685 [Sorangium cellulosum]HTN83100.1 hypothetical protein [Sorangium sp.]
MGKDEPPEKHDKPAPAANQDVVFIHSPVEQGEGFRVIRSREDRIEIGELRPTEHGRPLTGDLVKLTQRSEHARLFDVEVLLPAQRAPEAQRSGPAQVATDTYRSNWEAIFGRREESNKLSN